MKVLVTGASGYIGSQTCKFLNESGHTLVGVDRNIIKYNKSNGEILEKIDIPDDGPDPHGLSIKDKILWYSDAAFPNPMRPFPEIGSIELKWTF